jgi:hypothetical protein
MGIIGTHVANVNGTKASDKAAAEARELWDATQERLGILIDNLGGDNGFSTLKAVQAFSTLVDQMEDGGGLPATAPTVAKTPVAALSAAPTPSAPSPEEELGKKLLTLSGDETEANKLLGLFGYIMKNRGLQQVVVEIVTNVSDPAHPENVTRDSRGHYVLKSYNDLQLSYEWLDGQATELAELVNGYASSDLASAIGDAKKEIRKAKTTSSTGGTDADYIKRLATKAGTAPRGDDFDLFAEELVKNLNDKANTSVSTVLREIGPALNVVYVSTFTNDSYKAEIIKAAKKLSADLNTAQNDAKTAKDSLKKQRDGISRIAGHNGITFAPTDDSEEIVHKMIKQKGGYAQKLVVI